MRDAQTAKPPPSRTGDGWFAYNLVWQWKPVPVLLAAQIAIGNCVYPI